MKKVKIMLTAITVLAVVGGALAFKARLGNSHLYICDSIQNRCLIDDPTNTYTLDDTGISIANATVTTTDPGRSSCLNACPYSVKVLVEPAK
ncbi:hypothetical protein [Niastella vici]|nr:hypothetical protein [Niastella vici]